MQVIAIVQAHMGSTRLPGKVMMDVVGKPMLWHLINRLRHSRFINNIVVATTKNKEDDVIEEFCKNNNIGFYRGSEDDVLDRYLQAARLYKADPVVRISSDCPLIDPYVVDSVISFYLQNSRDFDGASNIIMRSFPRGLDTEVISFSILERAWREAKRPYHREHVTVYIYEHPDLFRLYSVEQKDNLSHLRWTVDEEKDLRFVREIYKRLYKKDKAFKIEQVLEILKREPDLKLINKDVKQKAITK